MEPSLLIFSGGDGVQFGLRLAAGGLPRAAEIFMLE